MALTLSAWAGDQEVAKFLFAKGETALRAKQYADAEGYFRRALEEHTPFPEASYGHGVTLAKLNRTQEAIAAYRACISAVSAAKKPTPKWKTASNRAMRALKKLRKDFAALDKLGKKHIRDLLTFAQKHAKANPRWARRAYETVLTIDPGNATATAKLGKLPADDSPTRNGKKKSWGKPLIKAGDLGNWDPGKTSVWHIRGSVITGASDDHEGYINWLEDTSIGGDYELRIKFRLIREHGGRRTIGFFVGDGRDTWWSIMLEGAGTMSLIRYQDGRNSSVGVKTLDAVKWTSWHTLKIEVKKEHAKLFLDDKLGLELDVERGQKFAGKFGLFIQAAKVEFKELELRK